MAEVELSVGGHRYLVGCQEGQEQALGALGQMLNEEIIAMRERSGNLGETRQLLYAALTLADRLQDSKHKLAALENDSPGNGGVEDELVEKLAKRVEALAEKLEKQAETP